MGGNGFNDKPGINVLASLEAENNAIADARVGGLPTIGDLIAGNVAQDPKTAAAVFLGNANQFLGVTKATAFSLSGSVGVNTFAHDVIAKVGANAVLQSDANVTVDASIEQKALVNTQGNVTTENTADGKKAAIAVAVANGSYDNTVQAIVENNASIDARRDINVNSALTYPLLLDNRPFGSDFNPEDADEGSVADELSSAFNRTGGLTRMMNTWASTSGRTPDSEITITASVGITNYINKSEAIIGDGAKINQTAAFQNADRSVNVTADTTMQLINVAGVLQVDLSVAGLRNTVLGGQVATPNGAAKQRTWRSSPISVFGNEAKTLGIGGSVLVQSLNNQTTARIGSGTLVRTGINGGLNVIANESLYSFDFVQTGGNSGKFGASGSVSSFDQIGNTVAQLASGVIITGGPISILANSRVDRINLTGAVQMAKEVGIGVSVGLTDVERNTLALIGDRLTDTNQSIGSAGTVINTNKLIINATNDGNILGVGVAGAVISDIAAPPLRGRKAPMAGLPIAIGVSGVANINSVKDVTQAYINDNGTIAVTQNATGNGKITVTSQNDTNLFALAGAATLVFNKAPSQGSKVAVGIAGSYGNNNLQAVTEALIIGPNLQASAMELNAERNGRLRAISVGISGTAATTTGGSGISVAAVGSVSVNAIAGKTTAFLQNVRAAILGTLKLNAQDKSLVTS